MIKKNYCQFIPIEYSLETFHRSNQDTCLVHKPAISEGDWVQSGDLLADCSSSVGGELSLGHNILVAYMPWEGYNYEDAILINERLVYDDVYTSIHIERYEIETRETKIGAEQFSREIPDVSEKELEHLDKYGIAKIGSWIEEGDILVGKVTPINKKIQSPYQKLLYTLLEKEFRPIRDSSLRAPKGLKSKVIKIEILKNSPTLNIASPAKQAVTAGRKAKSFKKSLKKKAFSVKKSGTTKSFGSLPALLPEVSKQRDAEQGLPPVAERRVGSATKLATPKVAKGQVGLSIRPTRPFATGGNPPVRFASFDSLPFATGGKQGFASHPLLTSGSKGNAKPPVAELRVGSEATTKLYVVPKPSVATKRPNYQRSIFFCPKKLPYLQEVASFVTRGENKRISEVLLRYKTEISQSKKKEKQEKRPSNVHIYLAEKRKIQVGDKMAGRHGNKGIISQILPRQDMPFLPDGTPIDIVLNPLGVPSRMNVGQIYECLLGFAGKFLGEHFKIFPFDEIYGAEASRSFVYSKLYEAREKTGFKWIFNPDSPGKIRIFDGRNGDCYDQAITVGRAYMLKLVHMVDDKIHSRSTGPYSLVTQQPLRGRSKQGGQRLGEMEVWAIEGYGAAFTLLEMLTIKSDDMTGRMTLWSNLIFNKDIKIGTPESFKVLVCELQALCLDIGLFRFETTQNGPPEGFASSLAPEAKQAGGRVALPPVQVVSATKLAKQPPLISKTSLKELTSVTQLP